MLPPLFAVYALPWTPPSRGSPKLNVITRTSLFPTSQLVQAVMEYWASSRPRIVDLEARDAPRV
eukprot:8023992-Pyramimonas_sp.AAC.1